MAKGLDEFAELLMRGTAKRFEPRPFYEPHTDSLIFYFRNEPSYSKRITKYLTLFLASRDDRLIGLEIKSVKTITKAIENLGEVAVADPVNVNFQGKTARLHVMAQCAMVSDTEEPLSGRQYEEIVKQTRDVEVDLEGAGAL